MSINDYPKPTHSINGATHFTKVPYLANGFKAFSLEKCECGATVIGPNSFNLMEPSSRLERIGMVYVEAEDLPGEQEVDFHDEDGGEEEWWCDACAESKGK